MDCTGIFLTSEFSKKMRYEDKIKKRADAISHPASPADTVAEYDGDFALAEKLLAEGEIIIYIARPSMWDIPLSSMRTLVGLFVLGLVCQFMPVNNQNHAIWVVISLLAIGRVIFSAISWTGKLYVLTNRRLLRVKGIYRYDVFDCPLKRVGQVNVTRNWMQAVLNIGTVKLDITGNPYADADWIDISNPEKAAQIISTTIRSEPGA